MNFKILHESGSLGSAARFRRFSHRWNSLGSWIWYPVSSKPYYGLRYGTKDAIYDLGYGF